MNTTVLNIIAAATVFLTSLTPQKGSSTLAQVSYSLANRYAIESVNEVFADNILLTIAYLGGVVQLSLIHI